MKKIPALFLIVYIFLLALPSVSAAHFIVGVVNNALDTTPANDKTIILWDPAIGINDNQTDIIGINGNSGADNTYLIDCELLQTPCVIGTQINIKVINNGDNYVTETTNLTVTGSGFDVASNLTLNSPPIFINITVDDSLSTPIGEIDLTPATTKEVVCQGVVFEYDGNETLINMTGEFFDNTNSFYGDTDDNNLHYTNNTCTINKGYGNANESYFTCSFQTEYYANSGNWNCTTRITDNLSISSSGSNTSNINTLLAIGVPGLINFSEVDVGSVSAESVVNVTNYGNVLMNLSLSGYGATQGDNNAMNCTLGSTSNITVDYKKYNLTQSNPGILNLTEFENIHKNLTSNVTISKFDLNYRQNDLINEAINSTYWRIYVPLGVAGDCSGNIVFGAVQSPEN